LIIIAPPGPSAARKVLRLVQAGRARRSRQHRHARAFGQQSRLHLVAEQLEYFRPRPDEFDSFVGASMSELRVLAEKAVARMDRVASRGLGDRDDLFEVEIGGGARAAQRTRLVGLARMQRRRVVL
jgi:hypothetical protein